ncbi:hypothetical protein ABPG73_022080 [Tetrahymena malaccensis]
MNQIIYEINLLVCITVVSALPASPISFLKSGQIHSTLCLFVQGIISYQAEKVYLQYMKNEKQSMDQAVEKQIGRKWGQCYLIMSVIYLLQLTLLYSFYAYTLFYQIVFYFSNTIFQKNIQQSYCMPISTLIISPLIVLMIIKRTKKQISKAFFLSSLSIMIYLIYIIVLFVRNQQISEPDYQLKNTSVLQIFDLLSSNNLAYVNQLEIHQILTFQNGKVSKQSKLSIKYSTFIVFIIYSLIGNLGSYSIQDIQLIDKNTNLIFDYFNENAFTIIVKICVIYHFIQNLSYKYNLLRKFLLKLILTSQKLNDDTKKLKKKMKLILNIIFPSFYIFINLAQNDLQYKFTIITGSLAGFFIIYLVPYKLQFRQQEIAKKWLYQSQKMIIPNPFCSMQEAQEEEETLFQKQLKDEQFINKNNIEISKKPSLKVASFFDKIILLFGFLISMYGIFSFIYFIIN